MATHENVKLRFQATFTNVLNHTNSAPPATNISNAATFGVLNAAQTAQGSSVCCSTSKGRFNMTKSLMVATLLIACTCVGDTLAGTSFAQKASVPKERDSVANREEKAKELLALMDTDKNGKVSKQEWMKFMEAEFDRLDTSKKGEIPSEGNLEIEELGQAGSGGRPRQVDRIESPRSRTARHGPSRPLFLGHGPPGTYPQLLINRHITH